MNRKSTNNWHTNPFLSWWEKTKREKGHHQFNGQQLAFMAWLAAIDYYINEVEIPPYPSPTEEAKNAAKLVAIDDLYDPNNDPMNWY